MTRTDRMVGYMLKLYIVIPCYNEEEVLPETVKRLTLKLDQMVKDNLISDKSRMLLVNDGSSDNTWNMICEFFEKNKYVTGITLSRNRGHQNALMAGLMFAKEYADIVVSMDADLQDDINVLDSFITEYNTGSDIVYGVRSSRKKDSFFKKHTALLFYKVMRAMGVELVYNHADYRLMSKRALDVLEEFHEVNLFLRGIIPLIGFKSSVVTYDREQRFAGKSKYPLKKMLFFAIDGVTSCSIKPIRLITTFGFLISGMSVFLLLWVILGSLLNGNTVAGWPTLMVLISFFGGAQILCIGVVGEYVGKIYNETKHRPRYVIEDSKVK